MVKLWAHCNVTAAGVAKHAYGNGKWLALMSRLCPKHCTIDRSHSPKEKKHFTEGLCKHLFPTESDLNAGMTHTKQFLQGGYSSTLRRLLIPFYFLLLSEVIFYQQQQKRCKRMITPSRKCLLRQHSLTRGQQKKPLHFNGKLNKKTVSCHRLWFPPFLNCLNGPLLRNTTIK